MNKEQEKQNKEILKLDILDCVGIKLAYLDDMRISKSKPLSVMKNMLSIDCHKDYILEALGITKDSVVLTREERQSRDYECYNLGYENAHKEMLKDCIESNKKAEQIGYEKGSKETAEKVLIKGKQLVEKWLSKDDEKIGFLFDFEEFIKKQFGVEIKE